MDFDVSGSETSDEEFRGQKKVKTTGAVTEGDGFFAEGHENETVEEKRLRATKKLIKDLGEETKNNDEFFVNLHANTTTDVNIIDDEDDKVKKALKYKILEQKDKLFYNIAKDYAQPDTEYDRVFIKGHKKAITDMHWMPDNRKVITSSKDCNLIMWDIESQKKTFFKGEKFNRSIAGHFDEVMTCAISPNGKYMISGGKDRVVRVWDIHNQKQI